MKRFDKLFLALAVVFSAWAFTVKADTGYESAPRKEIGRYGQFRHVSITTYTGVSMFDSTFNRADGVCFNNSAYVIWLGSSTRTMTANTLHPNFIDGFPILSSATFSLDGSFTGTITATCNPGATTCDVRCIDGMTK